MKNTLAGAVLVAVCVSASAQAQNPFSKKPALPPPPPTSEIAAPSLPVVEAPPAIAAEKVPAVRLGRVGDEYIYRGSLAQTYLFTSATTEVVRVPTDPLAAPESQSDAKPLMEKPPELPSMVGGKTQAQADNRSKATARPPAPTNPAKK